MKTWDRPEPLPAPKGRDAHARVNVRDLAWRCGGVLACAAAGGTTLLHRQVLAARLDGPATGAEVVLGLLSFLLASLGVLLLIHGAALHDTWRRDRRSGPDDPR